MIGRVAYGVGHSINDETRGRFVGVANTEVDHIATGRPRFAGLAVDVAKQVWRQFG